MGAERVRYDHGTQLSGQSTAPSKRCTGHPVCAAVAANPQHHWGLAAAGSTRRRTGEDARGRRGRAQSSERVRRTSNGRTAADERPAHADGPNPLWGRLALEARQEASAAGSAPVARSVPRRRGCCRCLEAAAGGSCGAQEKPWLSAGGGVAVGHGRRAAVGTQHAGPDAVDR